MESDGIAAGELRWRSSSFCTNNTCVEVGDAGDSVLVRDSKDLRRQALVFALGEWRGFIAGAKNGEFDIESN
jgi:hypothetical protein